MRLWEQRLAGDPLFALVAEVGLDGAAKELGVDEKTVSIELATKRYLFDMEAFAADQLFIVNKLGEMVSLKFNKGQKAIAEAIEKQRLAYKPVRVALLKARQFGGSTEFEGEVFRDNTLRHNRRSMIIAHDLDSSRNLRSMYERYFTNYQLPRPERKNESDKWWKFLHQGVDGKVAESHLMIDTADELSSGHSFTLHNLHLSEVQLWRNATELVKGLFPTVPKHPDTMIFMEGTGSGIGNYWYDFWQMATDESSEWAAVFVPWYDVEDYTAPTLTAEEFNEVIAKADTYEKELLGKGVSAEQLQWRRATIRDSYKGVIEDFMQQYPATPDEAFSTSGRPVFPVAQVKRAMAKAKAPLLTGDLVLSKTQYSDTVAFHENPKGLWNFWEERPTFSIENLYCGGVDVAEGHARVPELGLRGGDFSVGKILRRDSRTFIASIRARIDPDEFALELYKASIYYRRLPLLIENNPGGSGMSVINDLKRCMGVVLLRRPELNKIADELKPSYGWRTMKDTKRELIDELIERIRDEEFTDPSKNFWSEASTYIRDEKGLTNAQERKYDDEVIATALAFQAHKLVPMLLLPAPEEERVIITPDMDTPENRARQFHKHTAYTQREAMEKTLVNF